MLCAMLLTFSCVWEKEAETDLPEESGSISIQVDYRPLESALDTRSAGDLIRTIDNISIVAFNSADGSFAFSKYFSAADYSVEEVASPSGTYAESKVYRASMSMDDVPRGKYRIYAVVNMDRNLTSAETASESALKSISLSWQTTGCSVSLRTMHQP